MIQPSDVTMCLVTRGDQPEMMRRIFDSLLDYAAIIVWDNSDASQPPTWWYETERRQPALWCGSNDKKVAGRYYAAKHAETTAVAFQDDDVIVPPDTQQRLLNSHVPGVMVANWGHGDTPDGYDDLPLVCGGAIVDTDLPWRALGRYLEHWPEDDAFMYEADFVAGVLYREFRHLHLPFEINMPVAQHPSRLCNQPFQKALKLEITERARAIRDRALVAA